MCSRRVKLGVLAAAVAAMVAAPTSASASSAPLFAFDDVGEVRSIQTADVGVARPDGLAYSRRGDALLVADRRRGHTSVVRLSLSEERDGSISLPRISRPSTLSFDDARGRLAVFGRRASVTAAVGCRGACDPARRREPARIARPTRGGLRPRGEDLVHPGQGRECDCAHSGTPRLARSGDTDLARPARAPCGASRSTRATGGCIC